jgi:hypothetical protein
MKKKPQHSAGFVAGIAVTNQTGEHACKPAKATVKATRVVGMTLTSRLETIC